MNGSSSSCDGMLKLIWKLNNSEHLNHQQCGQLPIYIDANAKSTGTTLESSTKLFYHFGFSKIYQNQIKMTETGRQDVGKSLV